MVFPKPKQESYSEGTFAWGKVFPDTLSLYQKISDGTDGVTLVSNKLIGKEAYTLSVTTEGITIEHSTACGVFRAASTLMQLIQENGEIPCCTIQDEPDFENRGYMLDISRNRMAKRETIAELIDLLASLKYNEFQLYMEGIVYQYEAYPQCSEGFECLTKEDIVYLDQYCKERFIDFVPNQNSFGHMSGWLNRDEFLHLKVGPKEDDRGNMNPSATLNPLLPESLEFMDSIYSCLLPYFSSDKVNIGLDEAFGMGTYELEEPCKKYGNDTIFMDWLNKLADLIDRKYHKKVQFWADMIYNYPEAYKRLPQGAVPLVWGYDLKSNTVLEQRCADLQKKGVEYYVCPGDSTWVAMTGRFDVAQFNMRIFAEMGVKYGAKGYFLTNWGSGGHLQFPVWTFEAIAMGAQYAWNVTSYDIGWYMNTECLANAEAFLDKYVLHAPVSKYLRRLQRYYFLEPERVHCGTILGFVFGMSLKKPAVINDFVMETMGEAYQFEDVITYVRSALRQIEKTSFAGKYKRQAVCNAKMVIFTAELCVVRLNKRVSDEKIDEISALGKEICQEFTELWLEENYPKGLECMIEQVEERLAELDELRGGKELCYIGENENKTQL